MGKREVEEARALLLGQSESLGKFQVARAAAAPSDDLPLTLTIFNRYQHRPPPVLCLFLFTVGHHHKNNPPTMSKLSASSVRTTVKTLLMQSSLEGQAQKNDDGTTVGKKRNFVETIELQIGLKNYDPQRDKRFVSLGRQSCITKVQGLNWVRPVGVL